jgi:DNA modification methylase
MKIRDRIKELRRVKASELIPNPKNWRTHPVAQQDALKGILAEVGFAGAVLARELDDGSLMLIDGHMRAETTHDQEIPVLILDVDEAESDKLLATFDPIAAMAESDPQALDALLRNVNTGSEALQKMLADLAEGAGLYLDEKEVVEDEIPEPPEDPITKSGDLWVLGDHRLLCGDSTTVTDVKKLMGDERSDLMLTDPPYNVDYTGKTKDALKVENDSMSDADFRRFLVACFKNAFDSMKPGASFYIFHADREAYNFIGSIRDCGEKIRQCPVWVKNCLVMGRQDYQQQHEPILYGWKQGAAHSWFSGRADTTVFDDSRPKDLTKLKKSELLAFAQSLVSQMEKHETTVLREVKPNASIDHPTMKPVRLIARLIRNSTAGKGLIYDPFLGSGTTLIAAEQLGRKCYGMEISPQYCDVIVQRWEKLTGKTATLEVKNG